MDNNVQVPQKIVPLHQPFNIVRQDRAATKYQLQLL